MSVLLLVPTFIGIFSNDVKADSKSLSSTYISLMNSAKMTEIEDIENLTQNDLKVISLFLSNFYSPFNTALDSDMKSYNLGICVDVLTSIGVDQDAAKTLVSTAMNSSLSYMQPLFYKEDISSLVNLGGMTEIDKPYLDKDTYKNDLYRKYTNCTNTLKNSPGFAPLTVFSFWALYSKACSYYADYGIDNNNDGVEDLVINFYMGKDSTGVDDKTPVFKFNHSFCVYFGNLISDMKTSWSEGYLGNAMINTGVSEIKSLDMNSFANLICFTQPMYVDWVGNIIADVGDKRVVVVPAVMNPCAFVSLKFNETIEIDENGRIKGGEEITYLVSTFGVKLLQNTILPDKYIYNTNGTSNFFKITRGSTSKATWDNSWALGGGANLSRYRENLDSLDINVPATAKNKWDANKVYMTIPHKDNCKFYEPTDKLNLTAVTFDAFTNMDEDSVCAIELYDDNENTTEYLDLQHTYFATTDAYTHNDNFEAVLDVANADVPLIRIIFLTYVYLYKNGVSATGETFTQRDNKIIK